MRTLFSLSTLLFFFSLHAQNWSIVGTGVDNRVRCLYPDSVSGKLFVGGSFLGTNGGPIVNAIATWNETQWDSLSEGTLLCSPSGCYPVLTIERYNGNIYAGGMFYGMQNASGSRGIAKWNDTIWSSIGYVYGYIYDMTVYNNMLYVVGNFDSIDGVPAINVAAFDGSTWYAVADTLFENSLLYSAEVYQGKLVVGGRSWNIVNSTASIFNFDGTLWTDIGASDFTDTTSYVYTMQVYQNELYVGGTFRSALGAPGESIAKWNGSTWSGVGGGVLDTLNNSASVLSMCIHDSKLVVGGGFKQAGGIYAHNIALWDGGLWCGVGNPFPVYVEALASYNDTLYAGGGFSSIEGDFNKRYLAKWMAPNAIDTCGVMGTGNSSASLIDFKLFPNPASAVLNFQFSAEGQSRLIVVTDQLGREVWRNESDQSIVEFPAHQFVEGMYLYSIEEKDNRKAYGKFVVQR